MNKVTNTETQLEKWHDFTKFKEQYIEFIIYLNYINDNLRDHLFRFRHVRARWLE